MMKEKEGAREVNESEDERKEWKKCNRKMEEAFEGL
jgi:hypothetical protein